MEVCEAERHHRHAMTKDGTITVEKERNATDTEAYLAPHQQSSSDNIEGKADVCEHTFKKGVSSTSTAVGLIRGSRESSLTTSIVSCSYCLARLRRSLGKWASTPVKAKYFQLTSGQVHLSRQHTVSSQVGK